MERLVVDRDGAFFGAFAQAADVGPAGVERDGVEVERDELGDAEAGGVEQLQHRLVAERLGRVAFRRLLQQLIDLLHGERLGQGLADAGRLQAFGRVGRDDAFRVQVLEERLHGGYLAGHGGLGVAPLLQLDNVG